MLPRRRGFSWVSCVAELVSADQACNVWERGVTNGWTRREMLEMALPERVGHAIGPEGAVFGKACGVAVSVCVRDGRISV